MEELRELPKGWVLTRIGDITEVIRGASPRPKGSPLYFGGNIPWIMISDISREKSKYISKTKDHVNEEGAKKSRFLKAGTLILSNSGTVCVPKILAVDGCIHDGFVAFPSIKLSFKQLYLYYYFEHIRPRVIQENKQGVTQVNLNTDIVKSISIPIPPTNEQHRIVAKIEELFTNLDAGIESLKKVKAQLKRYRQAVLKHAFEGKLTEEWRTNNPPVEPASELLERILVERRKKWEEEQLLRFKEKGQNLQKNWKDKYTEPAKPDTTNLPLQPKGWRWSTTDTMFYFVTSGSRGWSQYYSDEGSTFIRVGNLDHSSISLDLSNIQRVLVPNNAETIRTRVKLGDILISITADVGMVALISEELGEAYINQHIALTRSVNLIHLPYLSWFLASEHGAQKQFKELQRGATKAGLGLDDIKNVFIPVPPFKEQVKIVEIIEERFSIVTNADLIVNNSEYRASRLRQAILKRAFEGKLVPQDPNDEPAEKLLDRIRLEKIKKTANIRSLS
jgi:type I restriction enzyme S subunit